MPRSTETNASKAAVSIKIAHERPPRFTRGLEYPIRREDPKAKALIEAIKNGYLTIKYDLVHAKANGTIEISRFTLDTKPTLPNIKIP